MIIYKRVEGIKTENGDIVFENHKFVVAENQDLKYLGWVPVKYDKEGRLLSMDLLFKGGDE